jgi:hypothetical protein
MSRYEGRPLVRLLECYVLEALGQLDEQARATMRQVEPRLRQLYGVEGSWQTILAAVLRMPPNTPDQIRAMWARNLAVAKSRSETLSPQRFAEMFVDSNFVQDEPST